MTTQIRYYDAVTVTLNPAIDRTIAISGFMAGSVNRAGVEHYKAGGKGVNVASSLAGYGSCVAVTGFLGTGNAGLFEELFFQRKIDDHFVRISGETRTGIKIVDPVLRQTTDINFPGLAPKPVDLEALTQQIDCLDGAYFVLSGSVPPGMDSAIYRNLTARLRSRGKKVVVDASGEALSHALDAIPYMIKPNLRELEEVLGRSLPDERAVIEAGRQLNARGIGMVVVSMGDKGACFITNETTVIARPPELAVKSTVGTGDAMLAGTIAGQMNQLSLLEVARLATAFSLDILTSGEFTSRDRIEAFMRQVVVTE